MDKKGWAAYASLKNKPAYILPILAVLWAIGMYVIEAALGWVDPTLDCIMGVVCVVPLLLSFPAMVILSVIHLAVGLIKGLRSLSTFMPILALVAAFGLWRFLPQPLSRLEMEFQQNREAFMRVVATNREHGDYHLPPSSYYDDAVIYKGDGGIVIEFYIDEAYTDFYTPLVFIESGDPGDVGACSNDGVVVRRLEPQWYLCKRDWL